MQTPKAWDVDTIKWTKADVAAGIYEYQFTASSEHASWKVVAGRGDWKSGTYLGAVVNAGSGDAELQYDNKVGVGVNCETGGLEVRKTYKIVVTVKDGKVSARVEEVAGGQNEKPAVDLSNGGIAGTMQQPKPWNVDAIKWTKADAAAGIYEYQFTASSEHASWKVVTVRGNWNSGAYLGAVVNAGSGDAELKYDNKSGGGLNCETAGLAAGKNYKIVVTVKDGKVFASVETM